MPCPVSQLISGNSNICTQFWPQSSRTSCSLLIGTCIVLGCRTNPNETGWWAKMGRAWPLCKSCGHRASGAHLPCTLLPRICKWSGRSTNADSQTCQLALRVSMQGAAASPAYLKENSCLEQRLGETDTSTTLDSDSQCDSFGWVISLMRRAFLSAKWSLTNEVQMRSLKSWHWKIAAGSSHLSNCRTRPPFSSISESPRGRGGTSPSSLTSSAQLWKDPLLPAELKALCCTIVPTAQNALFLWHCPPLDSPLSMLPCSPGPGRKEAPFPSPVLPERLSKELSACVMVNL